MYLFTKTNLDDAANAMLREAYSVYSVVFSGAIFQSGLAKIFPESQAPGRVGSRERQ